MKKGFLYSVLLLVFIPFLSFGQDTLIYYLNEYEKQASIEDASYIRKIVPKGEMAIFTDYYKSGKVRSEGKLLSNRLIKHGYCIYYYENGAKFREGNYHGGYKIGNWKMWYDNGILKSDENYENDTSILTKIDENGLASLKLYDISVSMYFLGSKGIFKDTSRWFYPNGAIAQEEVWDKNLMFLNCWTEAGKKKHPSIDKLNWKEYIVSQPTFKGDINKLMKKYKIKEAYKSTGEDNLSKVIFKLDVNGDISSFSSNLKPEYIDSTSYLKSTELIMSTKGLWEVGKRHNLPESFITSMRVEVILGSYSGWTTSYSTDNYEY